MPDIDEISWWGLKNSQFMTKTLEKCWFQTHTKHQNLNYKQDILSFFGDNRSPRTIKHDPIQWYFELNSIFIFKLKVNVMVDGKPTPKVLDSSTI